MSDGPSPVLEGAPPRTVGPPCRERARLPGIAAPLPGGHSRRKRRLRPRLLGTPATSPARLCLFSGTETLQLALTGKVGWEATRKTVSATSSHLATREWGLDRHRLRLRLRLRCGTRGREKVPAPASCRRHPGGTRGLAAAAKLLGAEAGRRQTRPAPSSTQLRKCRRKESA